MCGRFCCSFDPNTIKAKLCESHVTNSNIINWVNEEKYSSSYNVAPTNHVIVLHADPNNKQQVLHSMVRQ
jgi:putative SOS response-associated peptidase YedK